LEAPQHWAYDKGHQTAAGGKIAQVVNPAVLVNGASAAQSGHGPKQRQQRQAVASEHLSPKGFIATWLVVQQGAGYFLLF
jgi:hypothetical protein